MANQAMDFGRMQSTARDAEHAVFTALRGRIGDRAAAMVAWTCKTAALRSLSEQFPNADAALFLDMLDADLDVCSIIPDELAEEERLDAERLLEALEEGHCWA